MPTNELGAGAANAGPNNEAAAGGSSGAIVRPTYADHLAFLSGAQLLTDIDDDLWPAVIDDAVTQLLERGLPFLVLHGITPRRSLAVCPHESTCEVEGLFLVPDLTVLESFSSGGAEPPPGTIVIERNDGRDVYALPFPPRREADR